MDTNTTNTPENNSETYSPTPTDETQAAARPKLDVSSIYPTPVSMQAPPKVEVSSVYPTPTQPGIHTDNSRLAAVLREKTEKSGQSSGLIGMLVTILGVLVILSPFLSAIITAFIGSLFYGNTYSMAGFDILKLLSLQWKLTFLSATSITLMLIYLSVGVGIILRRESGRVALVVLSVIGIIASFYTTVSYSQITSSYSAHIAANAAQSSSDSTTDLAKVVASPIIPYYVATMLVGVGLSIVVIVFLTRPSVRELFARE